MADDKRDHGSRESTARANYDQLRGAGIPHEAARKISERASEQTHRIQDRVNSDRHPDGKPKR